MKSIAAVTVILMEAAAAMAEEVTSMATQVEEDTLTAVDMAAAVTAVELVAIACLTSALDFRNRTGVSQVPTVSDNSPR